jgi:hypothetical protein
MHNHRIIELHQYDDCAKLENSLNELSAKGLEFVAWVDVDWWHPTPGGNYETFNRRRALFRVALNGPAE